MIDASKTISANRDGDQQVNAEFPVVVASMQATRRQRRLAITVILLFALVTAALAPFATVQLVRLDAFIPVIQTVICVADLVTAVLLFVQYSVERRTAILLVASGYILSAVFAFLQTLAFPGGYAPAGVIGDGRDTPAWFFVCWHICFPLAILIYAFLKDRPANNPEKSVVAVIGLTVACALGLAAVLTWIVLAGGAYLPSIYVGSVTQQNHVGNLLNLFMWLWGAVALTVLLLRSRTVLDLWLMVTLCAWMPNFIVAAFVTAVRFSLGWYMGRCFALIASCTVLFVLLRETTVLYSRLANVVLLLRRERSNRLMSVDAATSSMAHELRQPLTAISASGSAALILVEKNPPALKQIQECLADIVESAHNAERVIASVRDVFKRRGSQRDEINIYDAVRQALSVAQTDVLASGVHVETELRDDLSPVMADRTQIQQVLSNLIKNALDAMNSRSGGIRKLRLVAAPEGPSSVVISIQDSGPGIVAENLERVFDPFFTTKADGMGLGLSICRTIVEDHGGVLRLARSDSRGSILEVVLPVSGSGIRANKERSPAGPRT